ncbi:MAG: glycoside hydrolase family 78 protein [Lachnospiraceae bacterium]|nr:glycoside hydrolase family 78 protein [Lachnospiraceae bacterium]
MKAINLKVNYRTNPLGIDDKHLRFTWCYASSGKSIANDKQCAFQLVAKDADTEKVLLDTKKVQSSSMNYVWEKHGLLSRTRVVWSVIVWNQDGIEESSDSAVFEMGLLGKEDWTAQWITGHKMSRKRRYPVDEFRKEFVAKKTVKKARLYATACGVYKVVLNQRRLPGVLAPGTTEYGQRLYYQTYDVTSLLNEKNTLDVSVGDGWYLGKLGFLNVSHRFGTQRKLLLQLEINYTDGTREVIDSDDSFLWCQDGPIRYADLKDGEVYDSNMIPSYRENATLTKHDIWPTAAKNQMILEHEHFVPKLLVSPSGNKILDFGQNMAGYIAFKIRGKKGQVITLRMGECLDHEEFSDTTLRKNEKEIAAKQEIIFTCSGKEDEFHPEFFYSGFRYALVEGLEEVNPNDFEAIAVYSDLSIQGDFFCSNEKLNQFYRNTVWSLKSNFVDIPTDCPQREKSGWDGDAQVFLSTASYITDTAAFFRKWLVDVKDCQRDDGRVANVSPSAHKYQHKEGMSGSAGWADAAVIIPYTLWKLYGDDRFIYENYSLMHGWKEYVIHACHDKFLKKLILMSPVRKQYAPHYVEKSEYEKYIFESGNHWGEWLEPDIDSIKEMNLPKPEIATAYTHYSMELLAEMLFYIGKKEEAEQCEDFSKKTKEAYNFYFVENGKIKAPRQSPLVRALALGLLSETDVKNVAKELNENVIQRNYTVGTGFLSTPYVLHVLTKFGYIDTAYKLMENEQAPGWLAMVDGGATTIWEKYRMYDEQDHPLIGSMNHYSPGAMCSFLFDTVCGIHVEGENHFVIHPIPGGTLKNASCVYESPYGVVKCSWKLENGKYYYDISIPENTTAEIMLEEK